MPCPICDKEFEKNIIYENDRIIVMSAPSAASSGHIQIYPKKHYAIFEEVPQDLMSYISTTTNKISMLLFELLKVHGTNIIIQNGIPAGQKYPHFCVNIIPRRTDDGLKLDWDLKQANPESLDNMHRILTEGIAPIENIPIATLQETAAAPKVAEIMSDKGKVAELKAEEDTSESDKESSSPPEKKVNYYIKSLERIP